jgi:endonuclease G
MEYIRTRGLIALWTVTLLSSLAQAKVEAIIGPLSLENNVNAILPFPESDNSEIIISRDQYVISWNKDRRSPNWVSWRLTSNQLGSVKRTNKFQQDPDLENYLSAHFNTHAVTPADYRGSCFDRGHQIPSGDRTDTIENNEQTFVMSNMIPQTPYLNRVIWEHLESYTRNLVKNEGKTAFIIDGPIYDQDFGSIGVQRDIKVPSKNFKIVVVLDEQQTLADINSNTTIIAVIMPNLLQDGQIPTGYAENCGDSPQLQSRDGKDWMNYKTSVAEIERLSGISFEFLKNTSTNQARYQRPALSKKLRPAPQILFSH